MTESKQSSKGSSNPKYGPTETDSYVPSDDSDAGITDYAYVKKGWGDRKNFTMSYGEKPTPDGFDEATRILGSMRENHPGSVAGKRYREEMREAEGQTQEKKEEEAK